LLLSSEADDPSPPQQEVWEMRNYRMGRVVMIIPGIITAKK